ncbi:aminotransferase DegT [Pseudoalteromonas sp. MSK9-3]|uniref:LegC family aminotransferase n=1 Tax=Pseudoalteromonas sp. MSK9-3 TaxID=1897633 RepID=UPI000E6C50F1|nr:LegC family aminotransferase [Pseudoalteromonas sp. MSK9-3]RJE77341.1 aminotransferase DegT [Pseudoalteromonas sp. MSK9-3]
MLNKISQFIQGYFDTKEFIPLHEPNFSSTESQMLIDCLDSTYVSTVGANVTQFESEICTFTQSNYAVTTNSGTSALHVALLVAGVKRDQFVITQSLTFVATCNALSYIGATPIFVDVSLQSLSLCPVSLENFLLEYAFVNEDGECIHKIEKKKISAVLPMHTFGHPADMNGIRKVCKKWNLAIVEDAAEGLGSQYNGQALGTFGTASALSFNGNKVITTGGGGALLTQDTQVANASRHLMSTAKVQHEREFIHDQVGFNYRMPNINASLGRAQLGRLDGFLTEKRLLADEYRSLFLNSDYCFVDEPPNCKSNFWLNAVVCEDKSHRDRLLDSLSKDNIMGRPIWRPMHLLDMYADAPSLELNNTEYFAQRLVNLPSSVKKKR